MRKRDKTNHLTDKMPELRVEVSYLTDKVWKRRRKTTMQRYKAAKLGFISARRVGKQGFRV